MAHVTNLGVRVLVVLVMAILTGCAATGPVYTAMADHISAVPQDTSRLVFYRTETLVGSAVQPDIRLNGRVVGRSQPGGFFYVDAAPGRQIVVASTEVETKLEVETTAGETLYIASAIGMGLFVGRIQFTLPSERQALADIPSLRYTGSVDAPATPSAGVGARPSSPQNKPSSRGVSMGDLETLLPSRGPQR